MSKEKDAILTLRISSEMFRQIKLLCISMSKQEGRVIGVSEFIRGLLSPFVKVEKQKDMFKKKK